MGAGPRRCDVKPNTQRVVRLLQQKLVGSAAHLELDGNGRISIPPATAVRWALKAVLLGMGDKFG